MQNEIKNGWDNQFFQVPNAIYDNGDLDVYELAIIQYIFRLANNGMAFPSFSKMAERVKCSRKKSITTIESLIKKGYLVKRKRLNDVGNQTSNLYILKKPKKVGSASGTLPMVNGVPQPSVPDTPTLVNEVHPINTNIINTNLYKDIVNFLNTNADTNYRATTKRTQQLIKARLDEGFSEADFQQVISKKCRDWKKDPQFAQYLRPETLFGAKFESYLNQKGGMRDVTASTASGNTRPCDSNQQLEGLF
ncbi:hypothetical protein PGRAN_11263 [Listeria grandensis FSL F6-0971]|uniref:Phage conserved hypothetical protein C-terminal domain-containing protein n=1 Tax=Listeria grandensis FSL F6-0971 TaxID=1265819 RepID=W7BDS4_9LIST|nr:conserved phage C-terminal domain-containing protein [Listeria grandensis]EUJ22970.1 hypothetical protein PGRAN_11263 [Listeria grandensis FSL F6-0971]